jgi:hypothetical protein
MFLRNVSIYLKARTVLLPRKPTSTVFISLLSLSSFGPVLYYMNGIDACKLCVLIDVSVKIERTLQMLTFSTSLILRRVAGFLPL